MVTKTSYTQDTFTQFVCTGQNDTHTHMNLSYNRHTTYTALRKDRDSLDILSDRDYKTLM